MVRETRHLWVGNLPENIREDRIREHFKRYGRVQSVKLLPRVKDDDGSTGLCATVAFMDIKSASKAHNMEHKLDERCLSTEYYEPAAIPGGSAAPLYVAPRFPHGPPEDHATFERSSHFYERREGDAYLRRPTAGYHVTDPLRGRARDRLYRNGPYTPLLERAQSTHHRALANAWSYEGTPSVRYPPAAPVPDPYPEERREVQPLVHKKRPKSSRSGSESGSNSGSSRSRSRSRSRSHSSSSSSQSGSSSCSSATSSPGTDKSCSPHSSHHGTVRSGRMGGVSLQSTVSAPHTNNVSPAVHSEDRRPLAICVRNLPIRSSDTSLKDGLFHEYKKHGKVVSVKVVGQAGERYAIVCFKKPEDAEKALEESQDKLFFGCKIEVAPYQGYDVDDNEFRPYEAEQDEYHPKATRTLFIGNLEKDITASELRKHFEQFGEIIEIDIKKQGALSSYAFCQFADISSVVKAMRTMDGEHLGNNRIKLGFGKSMPTNCVWVDGIAENVPEKYLNAHFHTFGTISHITIDRDRGHALIYFEQVACAQEAVREMRGFMLRGRKLQVDFASRECQEAFYEHLEKQGHAVVGGERPWERYDTNCSTREVQAGRFETTVVVPGNSRFTRYETPQRSRTASYSRSSNSSGSTPVAQVPPVPAQSRSSSRSQRTGQRYEYYDSEYPDRRYRNYDEFSQGSGASHDDSYEQELRDYGYCQRERGDSSPSPITCESEGMRRSVAVVSRPVRSDKSSSPCEKVEEEAFKRHALQSVVVSDVSGPAPLQQVPPPLPPPPNVPQHPPDIRHLQKERVHIQHLLEQLDDCTSSADEDTSVPSLVPKKRMKLTGDECSATSTGGSIGLCGGAVENCFEGMNHGDSGSGTSLLVTTHNHRKSLSEVRRMSDTGSGKHCSRRLSTDSLSKHGAGSRDVRETSADRLVQVSYSPHPVCKRRKTGSSTSESEDRVSCRSGKHSHHHHHHHNDVGSSMTTISGSESVDGSRPGTPLCDERPENLLPPSEPRRIPRERATTEGPLSLPLPRFAAQVLSSTPRLSVSISGASNKSVQSSSIVASPPSVVTSPRPISHSQTILHQPPSPSPAPPPASPPPRPPSLSSTSSDSEISPPSPTLEERIRSLDEKYEKWSGSRAKSAAGGDALAKLDASASERFRFRHKLLDIKITELKPSDIVKSVLAKRSVFDEDSKRLENFNEKYEPREFIPYTRTSSCFQSLRVKTECATGRDLLPQCGTPNKPALSPSPLSTPATPGLAGKIGTFPSSAVSSQLPPRLMGTPSPLHSPSQPLPKSPFSSGTSNASSPSLKPPVPLSPVIGVSSLMPQCSKLQTMPKTSSTVSPRPAGSGLPAAKGLQYPFPSHPPVLPTTTVATTTATNTIALVSVSSAGVKPSLSVTVPTTSTITVLSPEVSRTSVKPVGISSAPSSVVHSLEVSRPSVVRSVSSVTVLTTTTCTKPSPEVTGRLSLKLVSSASSVLSTTAGRVSSPGVLRLSFPKPTVTSVTESAVSNISSSEVLRSPPIGAKGSSTGLSSPEIIKVPVTSQGLNRVSTVSSSPQVTSRLTTSVISSPQVTSRVSVTPTAKISTSSSISSTSMSGCSAQSSKLARPAEHPPKGQGTITVTSRSSNNIPSMKSPTYSSPSESSPVSTSSSRVVTIPTCTSSSVMSTVTTVAAASTVTTTVVTVTMASTATTSVTSSTFTTLSTSAVSNSASEGTKHSGKPKSCNVSKKDTSHSVSTYKDKLNDVSLPNKHASSKKDSLQSPTGGSPTKKDANMKELDPLRVSKSKSTEEWRERKEVAAMLCARRSSERDADSLDRRRDRSESCEDKRRESADSVERRKEKDQSECSERERRKSSHSLDGEKEKRKENTDNIEKEKRKEKELCEERRKDKDSSEIADRRKEVPDFEEREKWKETLLNEHDKDGWKEKEEIQEKERRKDSLLEGPRETDADKDRRKEKKKDRTNSNSSPASIGCKRRMSSQDSLESVPDDAKRLKLSPAASIEHRKVPERRDSKDSGRSSSSSKRSSGERPRHCDKGFSKLMDDKIREERKQGKEERREKEAKSQDGFERHKIKDKQKKKSKADRDSPKDQRELPLKPLKDVVSEKDFSPPGTKKKDDSEPEDREEKHRHPKKEIKEKKKQPKEEFTIIKPPVKEEFVIGNVKQTKEEFVTTESAEEKGKNSKKEKDREKRNSSERRKDEQTGIKEEQKTGVQKAKSLKKDFSHSDTDSEDGSCDGPKKHSIFDIVDDGPAYISMYDKVKARSTKNMQKQEEEKRQEKMREKFNLLKQSRAKREEKKRSTSWDEDSDSDNPDRERKANKRLTKLMISSSSEDDGRVRSAYDCEDIKIGKSRPLVRIKKEDICIGDSDSDVQLMGKPAVVKEAKRLEGMDDDDDGTVRSKHLSSMARKGSRSKLVSDTSEDDTATVSRFKCNVQKSLDVYSADSEVDVDYVDSDDKHSHVKKHKNSKVNKIDLLDDDINPKKIPDTTKVGLEKQAVLKKITAKNKVLASSDDETVKKLPCDPVKSDIFGDDKQAIFRKSIAKSKACKIVLDSSDDDNARKLMAESVKTSSFSDDKSAAFKKFSTKNKIKSSVDSSDDDSSRKNMTDPLKCDMYDEVLHSDFKKTFGKTKVLKLFPDSSVEDTSKTFSAHEQKNELFNENVSDNISLNKIESSGIENISDAEAPEAPPSVEKSVFFGNSVAITKGSDQNRKKSHKKKQKRQKNLVNEDGKSMEELDSETFEKSLAEEGSDDVKLKGDGERKKHKRDKRKSSYCKSDGDGKQSKARKKKSAKAELGILKAESSLKREEKMEDIFGPLSDDSSPPAPHNNSARMFDKISDKWQVSLVYGSDSDSNIDHSLLNTNQDCFSPNDAVHGRSAEKEKKRKEKKRRERKAREEESLTVDLAEAGRVLEAKLMDDNYMEDDGHKTDIMKEEGVNMKQETTTPDTDVFRFTDGDESLETNTAVVIEKAKEKKKKRKKSKEEKQSRREHHHHHHHDKSSRSSPERRSSISTVMEEVKPPTLPSPSLPSLESPPSPPDIKPSLPSPTESPHTSLQCRDSIIAVSKIPPVTSKSTEKKKPEKFIPGFGSEIDDTIHETAVKSISEFEAPKPETLIGVKAEEPGKAEEMLLPKTDGEDLAAEEEKPRAVISQEETEDAVKALLGESFGRGFECYPGEGNGSGTNPSESQLPTDEEDETRKAVEGLIDMKPDTPQSEHELQIDTDTEDNVDESYSNLQYNGPSETSEEQISRTTDSINFTHPKTVDHPPAFYAHHHLPSVKTYESSPPLIKPTIQPPEVVMPPLEETDIKETPIETEVKAESLESSAEKDERSLESSEKSVPPPTKLVSVSEPPILHPLPVDIKTEQCDHAEENESVTKDDITQNDSSLSKEIPVLVTSESTEEPAPLKEEVKEEVKEPKEEVQSISEEASLPALDAPCSKVDEPPPPNHVEEELNTRIEDNTKLEEPSVDKEGVESELKEGILDTKEPVLSQSDEIAKIKTEEAASTLVTDVNISEDVPVEDTKSSMQEESEVKHENQITSSDDKKTEDKPEMTFPCLNKIDPLSDLRESEFSEPEPDMKTDIVNSLLASESMNRELPEDSRPLFAAGTESFDLFKEHNKEVASVIKETEACHNSFEEKQESFATAPASSIPECEVKPPVPDIKVEEVEDEFMSSPKSESNDTLKVDSIFWSTKEVNLDSVIKKVDALCSDEEMAEQTKIVDNEKHWLSSLKEKEISPILTTDNKLWLNPLKEKEVIPGIDKDNKMWLSPLREKEIAPAIAIENKSWLSPLKEKDISPTVTNENKLWLTPVKDKEVSSLDNEKLWSSPLKENDVTAAVDSGTKVWSRPLKEKEVVQAVDSGNNPWSVPLQEKEIVPTVDNETKPPVRSVKENEVAAVDSENKLWTKNSVEKDVGPLEKEVGPVLDTEGKLWARPTKELLESKQDLEIEKSESLEGSVQKEHGKSEEEGKEEVSSSTEHEHCLGTSLSAEEQDDHRITSASSPDDKDHAAVSTSSPEGTELERENQCHSTVTPRTSRRGRRGAGGRRKVATRSVPGVTTRRTRLASGGLKSNSESVSTPVSPRRGGRAARGAKVSHENLSQMNKKLTTDVYEFHDDSEDETANTGDKGRPRLILTIKSPVSASSVNTTLGKDLHNSMKPPPSPVVSPIVETREEFPSTLIAPNTVTNPVSNTSNASSSATSTRKSRRLQERDGSRTTVDDVIEDVVRGTIVTRSAAAAAAATGGQAVSPRRSTRQNNTGQRQGLTTFVEPRKSPRGGRKAQTPSRLHDELTEDKKKLEEDSLPGKTGTESSVSPPAADTAGKEMSPEKSIASLPSGSATVKTPPSATGSASSGPSADKDAAENADQEPMTLIDPVTGLLIPMRESEEGQYIPVTTVAVEIGALPPTTSVSAIGGSTPSEVCVEKPGDAASRPAVEKSGPALAAPKASQPTSLGPESATPASLWSGGITPKSQVTVISTSTPSITTSVRPVTAIPATHPPKTTVVTKPPTTLKAHVLQLASKTITLPNQPAAAAAAAAAATAITTTTTTTTTTMTTQSAAMKPHLHAGVQPIIKSVSGTTIPSVVTTSTTTCIKTSQSQAPVVLSTAKSAVPINPKAHLLQAVAANKPVVTCQTTVVTGTSTQIAPSVTKVHNLTSSQQQAAIVNTKTVSAATPINPKVHLLQAAAKVNMSSGVFTKTPPMHQSQVQGPGRPSSPPAPKPHAALLAVAVGKVSAPSPPLPQPPKAHHGLAQQPILTGAVASPPLKVPHHSSQQPIVTGASSSRVNVPKAQVPGVPGALLGPHVKGLMDPPKVEVSMGGCIVVPTASPQQRGQVMQAGLPVPAYEASLHAGSAGVVAELLPNPQFVLAQRQSPPPAHQHGGQGEVVQRVGYSHNMHDLASHYVHPQLMYQEYFRAQQEALGAHIPAYHLPGAVRSPMVPGLDAKSEADAEDVRASSPPLELRRPASGGTSLGARGGGGMAAHSLQSPHDRATDSPQVATVYVHGTRLPHYTPQQQPRYFEPGAEPPPAHLRTARHHHPMPGTEAPANQQRLQVATPPHASQVPPQADSLLMLLQRYPVMWQGLLALKNDQAAVQMHFVFGNPHVARDSLPCNSDGSTPPLRIAQRMRLEQTQVDGVARKMQMDNEHCMLLALPCGRDHMDVLQQSNNLQTGFITYLQQKQAAGIVNIAAPGSQQAAYVVHIFPSCDFANENLARIAPDLLHRVADIAHLLIIIATV